MDLFVVFLIIGIITLLMRVSFMLLFGRIAMPHALLRALRFVPPAVLSAIIVPELAVQSGQVAITWTNPRLIAGLFAVIIAWRTKNILLTIAFGMIMLWLLQSVLP